MRQSKKEIKLTGILVPMDWNTKGKITEIGISATNEEEYKIYKSSPFFDELQKLISQQIYLSGSIILNQDGKPLLHVKNYRLCQLNN